MSFAISKAQQKVFIENFMQQVLDIALELVNDNRDRESPGETIAAVGSAVIKQIYRMDGNGPDSDSN